MKKNKNSDIFYDTNEDLYANLKKLIKDINSTRKRAEDISKPLERFSWIETAKEYDDKLLLLCKQILKKN